MTESLTPPKPIRLKGRSFLALVLSPSLPFDDWLASLDDLASRSTGFFLGRPIVLDLEGLEISKEELRALLGELNDRKVRIMGIEGAKPSLLGLGMPPEMKGGRPAGDIEAPITPPPAEPAPVATVARDAVALEEAPQAAESAIVVSTPRTLASLLIDEPIRSGQSVVFPEGDVTVLGSVASGAEVVAGGSIHIYGTLRGRALAGSVGNVNARIFCRKLEAELLAIDGLYKMVDDMEPHLRGQSVQVWLEGDAIKAQAMN